MGGIFFSFQKYYCTEDCKFAVPEGMDLIFNSSFFYDTYELEERELVKKWIQPSDRVLELGGCIGVVACTTNKFLNLNENNHIIVEANPKLIPFIQKNRDLNNCKFKIEQVAVGHDGKAAFYFGERINGGSVCRSSSESIEVNSVSLRNLEQKHGKFNVLLMDIEGAELKVIEDSRDLLKNYRIIMVEWHPFITAAEEIEKCRNILKDLSFSLKHSGEIEVWENK